MVVRLAAESVLRGLGSGEVSLNWASNRAISAVLVRNVVLQRGIQMKIVSHDRRTAGWAYNQRRF